MLIDVVGHHRDEIFNFLNGEYNYKFSKAKICGLVQYLCTVVPIRRNFDSYPKKKPCSDARIKIKVSLRVIYEEFKKFSNQVWTLHSWNITY